MIILSPQYSPEKSPSEIKENRPNWLGLPYYPISHFYKDKFGEKIRKISITTAQTCPNRQGLRGMKTCNFCDVWGSAAYPEFQSHSLSEQIDRVRDIMITKYKSKKFLIYFQAYTTTFTKVVQLREQLQIASTYSDVVGFVIGTRPDCVSDAVIDLCQEFAEKYFVALELGVQSFSEQQLLWMRRGHSAARSRSAIMKLKKVKTLDIGIHLMFGLPGETDQDIIKTALECNELGVDNVKLHNLHVLRNTPLEQDYLEKKFTPISQEDYFQRCKIFLQHLNPRIAVHRLAALSNKPGELVAPQWTSLKMKTYQDFLDFMSEEKAYQGQLLL
ncbi:MAG: TIGR01212 family radical SAM protein [Bdellovibrionales bacterium]|nr:TIGR01212 family radical SAM protein [Bdellovibrionales bacterium]